MIIHNPELAKQIIDSCSKPITQEAKDNIQKKQNSVKVLFERKVSKIDLPEKKSVLSSISDNDLLNELIDRLIVNAKYSDREKLFEIVSETWKKRLFGENK